MAFLGETAFVGTGESLEKRDVSVRGRKSTVLGAWKKRSSLKGPPCVPVKEISISSFFL